MVKNKNDGIRSLTQKELATAFVANTHQTERIEKKREKGSLPEEPISNHVLVQHSET